MIERATAIAALALALALACAGPVSAEAVQTFEGVIIGAGGEPIGKVFLRGGENATVARIAVGAGGLRPGWHGVHFHTAADCSQPGRFERAKDPINHENAGRGLLHPEGPQEGNLPNIFVNADGSANAELSSESIMLMGELGLRDEDGSALVIYANEDDHVSPSGGGDRVACAAIK